MPRFVLMMLLVALAGCADQSKGAALNQCRTKNYLMDPATQSRVTPDCMQAKSFQPVAECAPASDEHEWDPSVKEFAFNNPRCYRPLSAATWLATTLSPM